MGSLALSEKITSTLTRPPELSDAEYVRAVLKQPPSKTENEIDQQLLDVAQILGVAITATPPTTRPATPSPAANQHMPSVIEFAASTSTPNSPRPRHARTRSTASAVSIATASSTAVFRITSNPSTLFPIDPIIVPERTLSRKHSKSISFALYDKHLSQLDPAHSQSKQLPSSSASSPSETTSISTDDSHNARLHSASTGLRRGLTQRLGWSVRRRLRRQTPESDTRGDCLTPTITAPTAPPSTRYCVCCRDDFASPGQDSRRGGPTLHALPCGHTYCRPCLSVMVNQSVTDESKFPPRCCTQPIPGATIKSVLTRAEQQAFLRATEEYCVPWEARIFCPNSTSRCGGTFIPPPSSSFPGPKEAGRKTARKLASESAVVTCKTCRTHVCVACKRSAHAPGQDCPADQDLDAVLRLGERQRWRRCHRCRALVELRDGCTHMTCRCRAQFCYICGAAWDPVVGCPNYCNGEEELERRRAEEERNQAAVEEEKRLREEAEAREREEEVEAAARTAGNTEFAALKEKQRAQMEEFGRFEMQMRWIMRARHSQRRVSVTERHADQAEKMADRHAKTEQALEDRQIEAEMELRSALEQGERSIHIQLKYMEAYCNGPHRQQHLQSLGEQREVTRKHRELLARQYHLRDGLQRRHESQINVLREKQAKRMEELTERHEKETAALEERRAEEMEDLELEFADEEEAMMRVFGERRARMVKRWALEGEILRRELETREEVKYGPFALPEWPPSPQLRSQYGSLPAVSEEERLAE